MSIDTTKDLAQKNFLYRVGQKIFFEKVGPHVLAQALAQLHKIHVTSFLSRIHLRASIDTIGSEVEAV